MMMHFRGRPASVEVHAALMGAFEEETQNNKWLIPKGSTWRNTSLLVQTTQAILHP